MIDTEATGSTLLAQAASSPMLDPPTRAVLLMALLGFVVLGLGLMAGVMLGGHWVRRLGGDNLRKGLPLRRGEGRVAGEEREPAMLRHTHWNAAPPASADTTTVDAPAGETLPG